jgi:hypothetical protein
VPSDDSKTPQGATAAGGGPRRLLGRLTAGYGRLSWLLTAWILFACVLAQVLLTGTPESPSQRPQPCGESYWEGSGRDGTPCP